MTPNHYPGSWGGEHSVQFALPLMVEAVTEAPSGSLACRLYISMSCSLNLDHS